jgi:serine-type D-Ala-D-Ala carboxypeptidase (penicillin-binding protein 5/6)
LKFFNIFSVAAGLVVSLPVTANEPSLAWQPSVDIASAFLLSVNGKTVWQNNSEKRLPPASLTKLVAALVIAENPNLKDWVTISPKAAQQIGTKLHLKPGEQFRAAELLGAMLIRSANDACLALVEWDSGKEAVFVKKMNAKLVALKLKNTHFDNACGFDGTNHYSTASDLSVIADVALKTPKIMVWTDMQAYQLPTKSGENYVVDTSNMLLGRVRGVDGLKTGFTQKAGKCLIAHAKRGSKEVLLVLLNAPNRWWDADGLINRAFDENHQ